MPLTPGYDEIVLQQREILLDQYARALAGIQGRPIGSEDANPDDEDAAWMAFDKNVRPEHLAMIAESTVLELRQQMDEATGKPMWDEQAIATEVKARQTAAQYPYRHLTYSLGLVKPEEQEAKARRVRDRVAKKYGFGVPAMTYQTLGAAPAGGWQEVELPDQQAPGLGDLMSTGQQGGGY
jgi:hypothetical protein